MIELYELPGSPCCMKVRMVLAEKNLDWQLRPILTSRFDHYQAEYQQLNPLTLIPTLVDDGSVLSNRVSLPSIWTTNIRIRRSGPLTPNNLRRSANG